MQVPGESAEAAEMRELIMAMDEETAAQASQPRASLPLSADIHLNALVNSYDRIYLCARSAEMGI